MKVVILCGGEGTRLREETEFRPKPMVEIGGRPILWHIMKLYAHQGFNEFILCLGYKGWMIKEYFLNYKSMNSDFTVRLGFDRAIDFHSPIESEDWKITLADTGPTAMTGARVKRIAKYLTPGEDFLLTYGDGLADVDLKSLLAFHRAHQKIATLTAVKSVSRFGEIQVNDQGSITQFLEKPIAHPQQCIAGGFFAFKYDLLNYLDEDESCILERKPLESLAAQNQLAGYLHNGYWQCMDTYREWVMLNRSWNENSAPWAIWQKSQPSDLNIPIPAPQQTTKSSTTSPSSSGKNKKMVTNVKQSSRSVT